jgi:hypothetical protein
LSTSSDRGNANINKSGIENQIEDSEKLVADNPAPTGSYGPFKQERRKGHQVISTATYYQVERRGSVRYGNGEAQDWSDSELESDGASYSGGNF